MACLTHHRRVDPLTENPVLLSPIGLDLKLVGRALKHPQTPLALTIELVFNNGPRADCGSLFSPPRVGP